MRDIRDVLATEDDPNVLVEGMFLTDYLALPHLSGSPLSEPSMKHVRCSYENEVETTDAMRRGAAADSLVFDVLVPAVRIGRKLSDAIDEFDEYWPVFSGTRRGKEWTAFNEEHGESYFRSYGERQDVIAMAKAIITDPAAAPYWSEGLSQGTFLTVEHGIRLKHRPDWIATDKALVDMKTTQDITRCDSTVRSFGYHQKMAMYRRAVEVVSGARLPCVLIFVEQKPPHDVRVMPLDEFTLDKYWDAASKKIQRVRDCLASGEWPGITDGREMPYEPTYAEMEEVHWADTEVVEV